MKTNRILLDERQKLADEVIKQLSQSYENGKTIISMLQKLGLTIAEIESWESIEQEFTKDYPKATLQFNLQANGIEQEYRQAEAFYLKNKSNVSFVPMTAEQIENQRDEIRIYAETPRQIEAHGLIMAIIEKFNQLEHLGAKINFGESHKMHKVFDYSYSREVKTEANKEHLISLLSNCK